MMSPSGWPGILAARRRWPQPGKPFQGCRSWAGASRQSRLGPSQSMPSPAPTRRGCSALGCLLSRCCPCSMQAACMSDRIWSVEHCDDRAEQAVWGALRLVAPYAWECGTCSLWWSCPPVTCCYCNSAIGRCHPCNLPCCRAAPGQ